MSFTIAPKWRASIKTRVCLAVGLTIMVATMLSAIAASLLTYSQIRQLNGERLGAAVRSYSRDLERMIANDQTIFGDFATNLENARKYKGMIVTNFSSLEMPQRTTNLAAALGAEHLAFYYQTEEESILRLRHMYHRELVGTVVISQDDQGSAEYVLYTKAAEHGTHGLQLNEEPRLFPSNFEAFSQPHALVRKEGKVLLRMDLPFLSFFNDEDYGLVRGEMLGQFVLEKELELDLGERDADFGLFHSIYDINGHWADGALTLPELDLSLIDDSNMQRLLDSHGEEYYARVVPLSYGGEIIGYLSASIPRKRTLQEIAENVGMLLLIGIVITVAVVAFSWKLVGGLMNPVLELTNATAEIADGNLEKRIDTSGQAELGTLARSFAHMRDSIREKIDSLSYEIDSRKRVEEELRRLRNLLSNIINSMPSVLVGVDPDGRVTQWNREAEKVTGMMAAQAHGRTLTEVFPALAEEMIKVNQAISDRKLLKDPKVPRREEGSMRFYDITVYPLNAHEGEGAVIRIDDVTERVQIEEIMVQSEKMLSVGGLAAGMAHEINNPLAAILQSAQVLRNRLIGSSSKNAATAKACGTSPQAIVAYAEQRGIVSMIDAIMDSGQRAARIVNNMLSFSRKSEAKLVPYDLRELLDRTVDLAANDYDLKKQYDFRQIRIVREYDQSMPLVLCQGSQIQQVFLNLLKNGAQAMAGCDRGSGNAQSVESASCFKLRVKARGNLGRVEVEDNGPGMDETTRRRVFEPFFTTKDVGVGTGLGLSVSYFIITENHNGTMAVESAPGKGSRFIIELPLAREPPC